MFYASLVSLGGELIEASQADYDNYKQFLRCPECGEPVFLRKAHQRGETQVKDAFVHHRAIPEVSFCEARVGRYSGEDIAVSRSKAKGQRLEKLKISLWKYLKQNLSADLSSWSTYVREAKRIKFVGEVVEYGKKVLAANPFLILDDTLPGIAAFILAKNSRIRVSPHMEDTLSKFTKTRSRDWNLHCLITREALELFLHSESMAEIRFRLCCTLCNPKILESVPALLDLDTETKEWKEQFTVYLTFRVVCVFLLVDWISIWQD